MASETCRLLLDRLRTDEAGAWSEFLQRYTPFLQRIAERSGLRGQERLGAGIYGQMRVDTG